MWDDVVDRAIDDVAREMTAGEPYGDLRTRVMDRVEGVRDAWLRPSRSFWSAALAMTTIALIALVVYRETRPAPSPIRPPDVTTAVRRPGPTGPGEPAAMMRPTAGPKGPALRSSPPLRRVAIPCPPIDGLAAQPIDIAPLAIDDLDTDSLDLQPLDTIAPIAVAPLGEGDRP